MVLDIVQILLSESKDEQFLFITTHNIERVYIEYKKSNLLLITISNYYLRLF